VTQRGDHDKAGEEGRPPEAADVRSPVSLLVLRNTVKALISRSDAYLLLEKLHEGERYYTLPGGGQQPGETLIEALQRECVEEIGTRVSIGPLRFVYEHRRESRIVGRPEPRMGPEPDPHQIGVVWIDRRDLGGLTINPSALPRLLAGERAAPASPYLGWLAS
jgi:ADP-ribose pyrophosphatase YjhB (NUDIX family)